MNASTDEVMIRRVGGHDAVDGGGVGASNIVLLNESTELRVVANSLDSRDGEYPEAKKVRSVTTWGRALTFQRLRSLIVGATHHDRNTTELPVTESGFEGLIEQVTIDRDAESEVKTPVTEQARELVDRVHVLLERHLTEALKGRVLSGATGLIDDGIVEGLVLRVVRGDGGRGKDRVLSNVTMRILHFLDSNSQLTIITPRKGVLSLSGWVARWVVMDKDPAL